MALEIFSELGTRVEISSVPAAEASLTGEPQRRGALQKEIVNIENKTLKIKHGSIKTLAQF